MEIKITNIVKLQDDKYLITDSTGSKSVVTKERLVELGGPALLTECTQQLILEG